MLLLVHVIPHIEKYSNGKYVFAFEELENNIHPSLQRRLLIYLRKVSIDTGCLFFLTTHSNVIIDLFNRDRHAQIIHIINNGEEAKTKTVKTYIEHKGVLDDLDVKASDLLQSNGIVWVEGPSDRIYFNRWIEIWTDGELCEGAHYQCVLYGGKLLSHFTANSPDVKNYNGENDWIEIFKVNRNAILLIDSDKKNESQEINSTKKRLLEEIKNDNNGYGWLTLGREIENYIPLEAIKDFYKVQQISNIDQFEYFFDFIDRIENGRGKYYSERKPLLAGEICPFLTKENIRNTLDLEEKLNKVCQIIRNWN